MNSLLAFVLKAVWTIVERLIRNEATRAEWAKKVQEATDQYNRGSTDSATVREDHRSLKDKAEEEWQQRWGTPNPPSPTGELRITHPPEVKAGEVFFLTLSRKLPGEFVFVDGFQALQLGDQLTFSLNLNTPGDRTIRIQDSGGRELARSPLKVVK